MCRIKSLLGSQTRCLGNSSGKFLSGKQIKSRYSKLAASRIVVYCLFFSAVVPISFIGQAAESISAVDVFKSYLQTCPNVKSVIFRRRVLTVPNIPNLKLPQSITNVVHLYEGAWQTNAFWLRELREIARKEEIINTNVFTADLIINGRVDDRWWDIINTQITSWTGGFQGNSNDRQFKVNVAENILVSVVHLGIHDLQIGSLHWHSNRFSAQSTTGKPIEGELFVADGVPRLLRVSYPSTSKSILTYECEYEYAAGSTNGMPFPSTIRRYQLTGGTRKAAWTGEILSLDAGNDSLPSNFFVPERFVDQQQAQQYLLTNAHVYKLVSTGMMMLPSEAAIAKPSKSGSARFMPLSLLILPTLGFIVILVYYNRKLRQPNLQNKI